MNGITRIANVLEPLVANSPAPTGPTSPYLLSARYQLGRWFTSDISMYLAGQNC